MKNIFPIFALIVLFFFCGSILLRMVSGEEKMNFGGEKKFAEMVKEKLPIKTEQKFFNKSKGKKKKSEKKFRIEDFIVFRKHIVQASIFIDFFLGNKILPNDVWDLGDGYLTLLNPKKDITHINALVKKIKYFKSVLDTLGIPLVYAQYPAVICNEDEIAKTGRDKRMYMKNELMSRLKDLGIPVIDLHEEFHKRAHNNSKEYHHSLFYKTDHHWRAKTSIWAGKIISEKLNELYGFGLEAELLDTNNFTEKFAGKWLGSMGEKVIPLYSEEDFYIYSPKYATDLNLTLKDNYRYLFHESNGDFDNIYHFPNISQDRRTYGVYYTAFCLSMNNNLPDGKKILLIGDSFDLPLSKFLIPIFKEVYFVWQPSDLLNTYIANKPDVVVLGYSNIQLPLEELIF